jgi:hypothetical protein
VNLDRASMEPFRRYHDFHNDLNVMLKVLSASAKHTATYLRRPECRERLGDLITAADPSWKRPPTWNHDPEIESRMFSQIGNFGVLSVVSAADDFADCVDAEVARWASFSRTSVPVRNPSSDFRLMRLIERLGLSTAGVESDLKVYEYFQTVRNCLAHRDSRASPALSDLSRQPTLAAAYSSFKRRPFKDLATYDVDDRISIHPKAAIFFSHVTRRIARSLDQQLLKLVGHSGFLNMAVAHVFSRDRPIRSHAYKTTEAVINFALSDRYRVSLSSNVDAIRALRRAGLWQRCRDGFEMHYERYRLTPN